MSAWVSPPQDKVSHMVEVAAIIAQAASTALPPRSKIMAPAVAASGLPVTAIQCAPCRAGFWVRAAAGVTAAANASSAAAQVSVRRASLLGLRARTWGLRRMPYSFLAVAAGAREHRTHACPGARGAHRAGNADRGWLLARVSRSLKRAARKDAPRPS